MVYKYKNIANFISCGQLNNDIANSLMTNKNVSWTTFDEGCGSTDKDPCTQYCEQPCEDVLRICFEVELSEDDKLILDTLVAQYV